jgi:transposase
VFILVSSRRIAKEKILPTYYTRQQIEQVFDIGKNHAEMTPLRVQNEDTFRGHLLMTFIATVAIRKIQDRLRDTPYNITSLFNNMGNQKCKVYDHLVITQEAFKKANDCYKLFGVKCPVEIPRQADVGRNLAGN